MTSRTILIAIVCGLIAALLFLSPLTLGGMGLVMSSFTALPLLIAVMGFGTVVGIISGVVAAGAVAIFFGPLGAASVLFATLAPALWIGHSVGLSRNDSGVEEWFPLSQILFRLTIISALIVTAMGIITGYSQEWALNQSLSMMGQITELQQNNGDGAQLIDQAAMEARARDIAVLIPYMLPVSILLLMVINLRLAERFVRRRGWMLRPKDDIPATANMPSIASAIFVVAAIISFANNDLGLIAKVIAGAFGGGFALVGLATVHFVTRGLAARPFILPIVYAVLLFSKFVAPVFAFIGLAENLLHIRARTTRPPKST
ncbi:MAG: DUF2232 domain-containing protein [Rhizobiaceae bacterium]